MHGRHHGRRHGAVPAPALRVPRRPVRVAPVLAAPDGRAPRVARAVRGDDAPPHAPVRVLPAPRLLRRRMRRGVRRPRRGRDRRRHPRHHDRLSSRRLEVPGLDEPLPRAPLADTSKRKILWDNCCACTRSEARRREIGFVGTGNIGRPMAENLLAAGHELIVHDRRREATAALLAAGAHWADSTSALAGRCEIVATCLPGPAEMESVCLGPGGILESIRSGALYLDHTTNSPILVRRVHDALAGRRRRDGRRTRQRRNGGRANT